MIGDRALDLILSIVVWIKFDHAKLATTIVWHHRLIKAAQSESIGRRLVFLHLETICLVKKPTYKDIMGDTRRSS